MWATCPQQQGSRWNQGPCPARPGPQEGRRPLGAFPQNVASGWRLAPSQQPLHPERSLRGVPECLGSRLWDACESGHKTHLSPPTPAQGRRRRPQATAKGTTHHPGAQAQMSGLQRSRGLVVQGTSSGSEDLGPQQEQSLPQGCRPVPSGTPGDSCHRRAAWALPGLRHLQQPGGCWPHVCMFPSAEPPADGLGPSSPWAVAVGSRRAAEPSLGFLRGPGKGAGPREAGDCEPWGGSSAHPTCFPAQLPASGAGVGDGVSGEPGAWCVSRRLSVCRQDKGHAAAHFLNTPGGCSRRGR